MADYNPKSELTLHISKANGEKIIEQFDFKAAQIFVTGGRQSYTISETNDWYGENVKRLYVHASYTANPWSSARSSSGLLAQMKECARLNAKGCVIHVNKRPVDELAKAIAKHEWEVPLFLEPTAVRPSADSYETPEKIDALLEAIAEIKKCKPQQLLKKHNIGVCLDTAHIFISTVDIKSYDDAVDYLDKLKYPKVIGLIHMNGADNLNDKTGKLTCKDKHNTPFYGYTDNAGKHHPDQLWGGIKWKDSGCKAFFEFADKHNLDLIREQNRGTIDDFIKFKKLVDKHMTK